MVSKFAPDDIGKSVVQATAETVFTPAVRDSVAARAASFAALNSLSPARFELAITQDDPSIPGC